MINRDIVEGLRNALSRGNTLEQAMMSFFNAGYKKEEIEEAARALHEHPSQPLSHPQKPTPEEIKKPVIKPLSPELHPKPQAKPPEISKPSEVKTQEKQIVSKYEEKIETKGKLVTILLLSALFVLILLFIGAFIFKDELINFFNNLF